MRGRRETVNESKWMQAIIIGDSSTRGEMFGTVLALAYWTQKGRYGK
jgi:hypothetical protein